VGVGVSGENTSDRSRFVVRNVRADGLRLCLLFPFGELLGCADCGCGIDCGVVDKEDVVA
jgi:hypothetical protein